MSFQEIPTDDDIAGRIMDKASVASPRALFAALQAAMVRLVMVDTRACTYLEAFAEVERRLDLGMEYGGEWRR